jgi:hypothetical protein
MTVRFQTLRIDSGDPLERTLQLLDHFQPQVLVAYASMLRLLAFEQIAGHLTEVMDGDNQPVRPGSPAKRSSSPCCSAGPSR